MEAELDATPGYEKNHKGDLQTDNKRNGHSTKNLKSQYGEFQIDVPRDRNGCLLYTSLEVLAVPLQCSAQYQSWKWIYCTVQKHSSGQCHCTKA